MDWVGVEAFLNAVYAATIVKVAWLGYEHPVRQKPKYRRLFQIADRGGEKHQEYKEYMVNALDTMPDDITDFDLAEEYMESKNQEYIDQNPIPAASLADLADFDDTQDNWRNNIQIKELDLCLTSPLEGELSPLQEVGESLSDLRQPVGSTG